MMVIIIFLAPKNSFEYEINSGERRGRRSGEEGWERKKKKKIKRKNNNKKKKKKKKKNLEMVAGAKGKVIFTKEKAIDRKTRKERGK